LGKTRKNREKPEFDYKFKNDITFNLEKNLFLDIFNHYQIISNFHVLVYHLLIYFKNNIHLINVQMYGKYVFKTQEILDI